MNKSTITRKALDLFAGAGGMSTGLEQAGFEILFANEVSETFSRSLQHNHPDTKVWTEDIQNLSAKDVRQSLALSRGELDLLAGGPPCQGFSVNAPKRCSSDERNHLFLDYLRFVEEFQPKVVVIENVPGMVSFEKGGTIKAILLALENLGYKVSVKILYAPHYGVPQMRWRTIFIANTLGLTPDVFYPTPNHLAVGRANFSTRLGKESLVVDNEEVKLTATLPFVTVADAISDLPVIDNKGGAEELDYLHAPMSEYQKLLRRDADVLWNHQCAGLGKANLDRLPFIPQGGSWRDIPFDLLPAGMKKARRSDHTQRYGRLALDGIGSTILTKCDPHWGRYIHPTQDRVLSVREAARIQSFPDTSRFFGKLADQYMQVGNAVPPLFAKSIGNRIMDILNTADSKGVDAVGRGAWGHQEALF